MHSARHVRTITVEYNTEVENDESALWNQGLGGSAVRERGTSASGDDGLETHGFGAPAACGVLDFGGNFALFYARTDGFEGRSEDFGAENDRFLDQKKLCGVFDHADVVDNLAGGNEFYGLGERFSERFVLNDREAIGFDAELAGLDKFGGCGDQASLWDDDFCALNFVTGLLGVTAVREEGCAFALDEQETVGAGESDQVADVGEMGD